MKKIISILAILIMVLTIFASITFAEDTNEDMIYGGYYGNHNLSEYAGTNNSFRVEFLALFNKNPNVFCVEHGKTFPDAVTNYVSLKHDVIDSRLLYILNLPDGPKGIDSSNNINGNYVEVDFKQNLIWKYLKACKDETKNKDDFNFITGIVNGKTFDTSTLNKEINNVNGKIGDSFVTVEQAWEMAERFAETYKTDNVNIVIDNIYVENNMVNVQISGTYDDFEVYLGNSEIKYGEKFTSSDLNEQGAIQIPLNKFEENNIKVSLKAFKTKYKAYLYVLSSVTGNNQRVIWTAGETIIEEDEVTESVGSDVSLQKYITKVNGEELTSAETTLADRANLYANSSIRFPEDGEEYKHFNVNVEKDIEVNTSKGNKYDKPVLIKAGDIVEYTITAYNNSNFKATGVEITDEFFYNNLNKYSVYKENDDTTELIGANLVEEKPEVELTTINGVKYLKINDVDIEAGEKVTYKVVIQYNSYLSAITTNKAWISSDNKSQNYRTYDEDYVYMQDVSIQKYVTGVNNTVINDRVNRIMKETIDYIYFDAVNSGLPVLVDESKAAKYNDIVAINVGDTVEYTITAYNNSEITVKANILDEFNKDFGVVSKIVKVTDDGDKELTNINEIVDNETGKININDVELGEYKSQTFKVYIQYTKHNTNIITNSVSITCDKNNEIYRTYDEDYVQMKKYSVSLEKYIVAINGKELTEADTALVNREGYAEYSHDWVKKEKNVQAENNKYITYAIKVTNTGNSAEYGDIQKILVEDTFGTGFDGYYEGEYAENKTIVTEKTIPLEFNLDGNGFIYGAWEYKYVTLKISENASEYNGYLKNTAEIIGIYNINNDVEYKLKDETEGRDDKDSDYVKVADVSTNVSMQKYISYNDEDTSGARKNKDIFEGIIVPEGYIHYGKDGIISNNGTEINQVTVSNEMTCKKLNPEHIKINDVVAYTLEVYNNDTKEATATLTDKFEKFGELWMIREDANILYGDQGNTTSEEISIDINNSDDDFTKLTLENIELEPGQTRIFEIIIQYNSYKEDIIVNKAYVDSDNNTTEYRTYDEDYVVMEKTTNVSLQKYITKVNNTNITGRENRYADNISSNVLQDGACVHNNAEVFKNIGGGVIADYKKIEKPEIIELGDKVEYTITVYNNSKTPSNEFSIVDYYRGDLVSISEGDIVLWDENTTSENIEIAEENKTIEIKEISLKKGYDASRTFKIVIKYGSYVQDIAENIAYISSNENEIGNYRNYDEDYIKMKTLAVSLEKYIVEVNGEELTGEAKRDGKAEHKYDNDESTKNKYKPNNPVGVEYGETVTYAIKVTNNGETTVRNIIIKDTFPEENCLSDKIIINKIEYSNGDSYLEDAEAIKTALNEPTKSNNILNFTIGEELKQNESIIIYVIATVKQPDTTSDIYTNYAEIMEIQNRNGVVEDTTLNDNADADYIEILAVAVSLEKFVSKVNPDKEDEVSYVSDRQGHPVYAPNGMEKENNEVELEVGDTVEFIIRLKNTGYTPVKVTAIQDNFTPYGNGELKLILDEKFGIIGNGNGVIEDDESTEYVKNISFANPIVLEGNGSTTDITIRFNVDVGDDYTSKVQAIANEARILKIENRNNIEIADSDGENNNSDADFVKTKIYKVSLEKYVVAINGEELTGEAERDGKAEHKYDNDESTKDKYKPNNPVGVEYEETVTYAIKVTNNGNTFIKNLKLQDEILGTDGNGSGFGEYYWGKYGENGVSNSLEQTLSGINAGEHKTLYITIKVTENNISLKELVNYAKILEIRNKNDIKVLDSTPNDNEDKDFVNMKDIIISGMVWNDKAFTKDDSYNGLYDDAENTKESKLSGIKVYLYRDELLFNVYNVGGSANCVDNADCVRIEEYYIASGNYDINGDGNIDDKDVRTADFNGDGEADTTDKLIFETYKGTQLDKKGRIVGIKTTNSEGNYVFDNVKNIKALKIPGTNRWEDEYCSYYVVFEYDGMKYTSTPDGKTCISYDDSTAYENEEYLINSNASEENNNTNTSLYRVISREDFNEKFETINNSGTSANGSLKIDYDTVNEEGYIPQSIYKYNASAMYMQSSTTLITLSETINEEQLKHINLGLRGRDLFDLSLTSNVDNIKVTVNKVSGVYNRDNVTLRTTDINPVGEDMANIENEGQTDYILEIENRNTPQYVRGADIINPNPLYGQTGLEIDVTYKITVKNESVTPGFATRIINYYDKKYSTEKVGYYFDSVENIQWISADNTNDSYNFVEITIPEKMLNQTETCDIYIVYKLNNPSDTLSSLLGENPVDNIPTYNMAEIAEYKTSTGTAQTEYTRGLIDKDSAPGSANKEQVRTTDTVGQNTPTVDGNPTTVKYYFEGQGLNSLKYEDDTYVAPTLYFALPSDSQSDSFSRIIEGTVFRDETKLSETKIKSGNGKLDEGEAPVYGATVQLIKVINSGEEIIYKKIFETTSDVEGKFEFRDFLPGDYIIRYYYGDTADTVLLHQSDLDGNDEIDTSAVNTYSFNGEDYQSTNNSYRINGMDTNKLNETPVFWYVYNEEDGISTATDNAERRQNVSANVIKQDRSDNIINLLNAAKRGENVVVGDINTENTLIEQTYMFADTPEMHFTLEKTYLDGENNIQQYVELTEYTITNMNFGIAEVPVTILDLQKNIKEFTIKDSTGQNIIAAAKRNNEEKWEIKGDVLNPKNEELNISYFDVSIEDEKLQGAKLQVIYEIKANKEVEYNYDETDLLERNITIGSLVDIGGDNLLYNKDLNDNDTYWAITEKLTESSIEDIEKYNNTFLKAKDNTIEKLNNGESIKITLERVLSSTDATLDEINASNVDRDMYKNIVEITSWNTDITQTDRIRNKDGFIIIPKKQYDTAKSDEIIIHQPTGDNSIHIVYYILTLISLVIITGGIFGIKKFVLNNNK